MQLVKGNRRIQDHWVRLDGKAQIPDVGDIIVPITRWPADRSMLLARKGGVGVVIEGGDSLEAIREDLEQITLVVLDFPSFADGRNYSNARLLRERHRYTGELRAVGEVLRDQLFYLARCGIDAYEVRDDCDIDDFLLGLNDFSQVYQATGDDRTPIYRLRARAS